MMGVNSCLSMRQVRAPCHCPACPRASGHGVHMPPQTLVLPPMALEPESPPVKDKKGSKMKVLKKIKKKIGLAPRDACGGGAPNNLPPLSFHRVHGDNVRLSRDNMLARRVDSFCKGVAFSARPVRVGERVRVRFADVSSAWSGVLRFGFTAHDPATLPALPKYACPDLTARPGHWAKALAERFCEKDAVLHYYVTAAGDVHFGVNGEEHGLFLAGVDARAPLWALLDVYGNCTAVALEDARAHPAPLRALAPAPAPAPAAPHADAPQPLALHRTRGAHALLGERGEAQRAPGEFCLGYVFSARPLRPGQTLLVQILATEPAYAGSLAVGLTSCDPATLRPADLPEDAEQLLDRPEYWVVRRDAGAGLRRGDELCVTLTAAGEVRLARNGAPPQHVLHVDHSLRLWAFVDVFGATTRVRLLTTGPPAPPPQPAPRAPAVLVVSLPPQPPAGTLPSAHYIEPMQSTSSLCLSANALPALPAPRREMCASSSQNSCNEQLLPPLSMSSAVSSMSSAMSNLSVSGMSGMGGMGGGALPGAECTVCYEAPVDSVLYMCGHMCMCYRCAVQQWRGKGGGQCPLCRAQIKDVIRTYKS